MGWDECIKERHVKKYFIDKQRAKSLRELSKSKYEFADSISIKEDNAHILFSEMYDSVLELCHSIACMEGFKILNHECIKYLLERLDLRSVAEKFDRFRKIRNRINYYGKKLNIDFSKESMKEMKSMINELNKFFKERYNK